jgi:hypothetical protein
MTVSWAGSLGGSTGEWDSWPLAYPLVDIRLIPAELTVPLFVMMGRSGRSSKAISKLL